MTKKTKLGQSLIKGLKEAVESEKMEKLRLKEDKFENTYEDETLDYMFDFDDDFLDINDYDLELDPTDDY